MAGKWEALASGWVMREHRGRGGGHRRGRPSSLLSAPQGDLPLSLSLSQPPWDLILQRPPVEDRAK